MCLLEILVAIVTKVCNIRIVHGCEVWIEALLCQTPTLGIEFSIHIEHSCLTLFLAYLLISKVAFITKQNDVGAGRFLI